MTVAGVADVRVVVAVLTYRRNEQLAGLLPILVKQCERLTARVVVVDNEPSGRAERVVQPWIGTCVSYVHEPGPGLASARNRALDAAAGADLLAFLDDDEIPGADWLLHLVRAWKAWGCTAVAGPVRWKLTVDAPWVAASMVLDRAHRPTGVLLRGAATNNILLDLAAVDALGLRFDERFGLSGGEDTMFTHLLVRRGGSIRWSDEAEVVEPVPRSRATRRWILSRTFRSGTTWSRVHVLLAGSAARRRTARLELVGRGLWRVAGGTMALVTGTVRADMGVRAPALCAVASGAGMVLGAVGYAYREYGRDERALVPPWAPSGPAQPAGAP